MNMEQAVRSVLGKYADFSGRARRSEYWYWTLAVVITNLVLRVIDGVLGISLLSLLFSLAVIIPGLAVAARRLHDTGRSGWWQLLALLPIIGWIALLIWYTKDSDPAANAYGPSPKSGQSIGYGYGEVPST